MTFCRQELIAERAKQKETELDKIKRTMMETGMVLFYVLLYYIFPLSSLSIDGNQPQKGGAVLIVVMVSPFDDPFFSISHSLSSLLFALTKILNVSLDGR